MLTLNHTRFELAAATCTAADKVRRAMDALVESELRFIQQIEAHHPST